MLHQNQTSGCLPCHNGKAKNQQTRWRHKRPGASSPVRCRDRALEPTPTLPGTPPTLTGNTGGAQPSQIVNLQAGYTYSHAALPCVEFSDDDADTQHDTNFDPDMLTDDG